MLFCNLLRMNTPPAKLLSNRKGQGSLVAVILASVIGTIIIGSATQWYLSMHKNIDGMDNRLEAMTIAMSEWQRLEHMSLDELENNRTNYQNPWSVGDKYKVSVELGEQGTFDEGKCNALTGEYAGDTPNCFRDTIMKVYDSTTNNVLYTTRSLPLTAGGGELFKLGNYQSIARSGKAPKSGFLIVHRDDSGYTSFRVTIDGVARAVGSGDGSYGGSTHMYTIPIKKGATYSISGGGVGSVAFVPIKGLGADDGSGTIAPAADKNAYVYNDDQDNRIAMKYDAESDSVKVYVNGQEKPIDLHNRYVRNPDMGTRTLMKEGNNFTEIIPFDGFLEMNYSACCCSTYIYLNDNLVASTYNSETTNRSQSDVHFIHVKAGDKIRVETNSYSHANPNTVRLYMYNYIK